MLGTRCFPEKAFRGTDISRIRIDLGNLARLDNSRVRERGACTEGVLHLRQVRAVFVIVVHSMRDMATSL